jgi:hypothetical protein
MRLLMVSWHEHIYAEQKADEQESESRVIVSSSVSRIF